MREARQCQDANTRRKRSEDNIAFRRTAFLDDEQRPDDYEVRYGGRIAGRIYRMRSTGRH
jgi:hypothetical protein